MNTYTQQFAASCGYTGNSPAMLAAFEDIRQAGIREARKAHHDRLRLVDDFVADPDSFWSYINLFRDTPILTTDEAVEFWSSEAENQRVLREAGHWRYDAAKLRVAAGRVVIARYFRRFGANLWQRKSEVA